MKKMQIRMQLVCHFSMLLLFFPVELFAQQGTITGKVVDERGESVIGATVMVKGFSLMVPLPIWMETLKLTVK